MNKKLLFLMILIAAGKLAVAQTQIGSVIAGVANGDFSGASVGMSADGTKVVIASPFSDVNGINSGQVKVFGYNGTEWSQIGADINGLAESDNFGMNVSMSADGNTIAICAPYHGAGQVKIYSYSGGLWNQVGNEINGLSGFLNHISLSADGQRIAISSPNDSEFGTKKGQIRIFSFNGIVWASLGDGIYGETNFDQAGSSLAFSADGLKVAVGSPFHDVNATDSGQVRIYKFNGTGWAQMGNAINGEAADDQLGGFGLLFYNALSLSADGNMIAIGAPKNSNNGSESGKVRVFGFNGTELDPGRRRP
ncbi:WD40 repeat domain-containing protein [Flavobacterium sp. 3HN19-14]|uniref:WD40 repeat domain-containing protein n=1 Tax=Flavobacterium sp. 3HN19-14 TaxID=3448133 RepID=UPI003EDEECE2